MDKLTIDDLDPMERKAVRLIERLSDRDRLKVLNLIDELIGDDADEELQDNEELHL